MFTASDAMRFHAPCSVIAPTRPVSGASTRTARRGDRAAKPSPMPVNELNSGWAKPVSGTRTMKIAVAARAPAAYPFSAASPANPCPPR